MEKFVCPKCGRTSYSANRELLNICPYCGIDRYLILSPRLFSSYNLSEAKIIIDRRKATEPVPFERRGDEEVIPVAWLVIKRKDGEMVQESHFSSM